MSAIPREAWRAVGCAPRFRWVRGVALGATLLLASTAAFAQPRSAGTVSGDTRGGGSALTPRPAAPAGPLVLDHRAARQFLPHDPGLVVPLGDRVSGRDDAAPLSRSLTEFAVYLRPASVRGADALSVARSLGAGYIVTLVREVPRHRVVVMDIRLGDARTQSVADAATVLARLRRQVGVHHVRPVYVSPDGARFVSTAELLAALRPGAAAATLADAAAREGLDVIVEGGALDGSWARLRQRAPEREEVTEVVARLAATGHFEWVEPDWLFQIQLPYTPNDPLFTYTSGVPVSGPQWHHQNLGTLGSFLGADQESTVAWDITRGDQRRVVALLDTGLEASHPDFTNGVVSNLWVNTDETGANATDDDFNGFVDDVAGWDFFDDDADPSPATGDEHHGTMTAGVAAAFIGNALGVAGTANVRLMPLRVADAAGFGSASQIANAIAYAQQNGADVMLHGWAALSTVSSSSAITNAITAANSSGRGGLGTPSFFPSGNFGSTWNYGGGPTRLVLDLSSAGVTAGNTYQIDFRVERALGGADAFNNRTGVDNVILPDGSLWGFEDPVTFPPVGWTNPGPSSPTPFLVITSENMTATQSSRSIVTPSLDAGDDASILSAPFVLPTDVFTLQYSYMLEGAEFTTLNLDFYIPGSPPTYVTTVGPFDVAEQPTVVGVAYPASLSSTIAVGSSTDWDDRADYSQRGSSLDVMAPSNGGWQPLWTTDRTGADGLNVEAGTAGDYWFFGGTSGAAANAAAIGALVLDRYPRLAWDQLRLVLRHTASKVEAGGQYTYSGAGSSVGRDLSNNMGYGRVDAQRAIRFGFPTFSDRDSMSMTLAGQQMQSFTDDPINVLIGVPATSKALLLGIFDGDAGDDDTTGAPFNWTAGNWDYSTQTVTYALYADPDKTGTTMTLLTSWTSTSLANNRWFTHVRPLDASAYNATADAHFYRLVVTPASWSGLWCNSFKVGSNGQVSIPPGVYLFQSAIYTMGDFNTVYPGNAGIGSPGAPAITPVWSFHPYYPTAPSVVDVWDGDFDYGDVTVTGGGPVSLSPDTDDANTAPAAVPPSFSGTSNPEGVQVGTVKVQPWGPVVIPGIGNAPDNYNQVGWKVVTPSFGTNVVYTVEAPGLPIAFQNLNPSGENEWELFRLASGADATAEFDNLGPFSSGFATIEVQGMDFGNIGVFAFDRETFVTDDELPLGGVTVP